MPVTLTADDKREIERQLAALKEAKADIARAKSAGIDVADMEAQLAEIEGSLRKLKAAYFPTGG